MIEDIQLIHYLSESAYKKACKTLALSDADGHPKNNFVRFENQGVYYIELMNILYHQFGRVWFLFAHIDFPRLRCEYGDFDKRLYESYHDIFGDDVMADFPAYEDLACDHIEFSDMLEFEDAGKKLAELRQGKLAPQQLDRTLWSEHKKSGGTLQLLLNKEDDTHISVLARCHGTALKKRIGREFHRTVGIIPSKMVDRNTEREIMAWLYKHHGVTA